MVYLKFHIARDKLILRDHNDLQYSDAIAFWLLLNLKGGLQDFSLDEAHAMQILGLMLFEEYAPYWWYWRWRESNEVR